MQLPNLAFEPVGCELYPSPRVTLVSWGEKERDHKLELAHEIDRSVKPVGQRRLWFDGVLHDFIDPMRPDRSAVRGDHDLYCHHLIASFMLMTFVSLCMAETSQYAMSHTFLAFTLPPQEQTCSFCAT
jgi:hypothetical protein